MESITINTSAYMHIENATKSSRREGREYLGRAMVEDMQYEVVVVVVVVVVVGEVVGLMEEVVVVAAAAVPLLKLEMGCGAATKEAMEVQSYQPHSQCWEWIQAQGRLRHHSSPFDELLLLLLLPM